MKKIVCFFSSLILFLLAAYTIHDMQTSQGVGYYFCLLFSGENRVFFDIIADIVFVALFALLLVIPLGLRKIKKKQAFGRFIILFLAVMPSVRTDYPLTLISNPEVFHTEISVSTWLDSLLNCFHIIVIIFPLILGYYCAIKGNALKKTFCILPVMALCLSLTALFVPALSDMLFFFACYLLIISLFDILEKSDFNNTCFYGFLFLTAVYRLLFVTASWSI